MRLSRTSFFTDRRGNASGDAARARRRSPSVLMVEIDGMPDSIPARIARCIRPFVRRARSCSRIAAAARSARKTRSRRSIADWRRGADGLELDVHLSRDGIVVVHHDAMLDRTTRAKGPLKERTASELAEFDVPPLRAVLARYPKVGIIIELKERGRELAEAVVDEVRRAGASDRVCLGSFSVSAMRAARAAAPAIATSGGAVRSADGAVSIVVRPLTGPRPVSGVPGSRNQRLHARRLAAIRAARAQSRHRRARMDGGRAGRHSAIAGLGRGRHHLGPSGRCGAKWWGTGSVASR